MHFNGGCKGEFRVRAGGYRRGRRSCVWPAKRDAGLRRVRLEAGDARCGADRWAEAVRPRRRLAAEGERKGLCTSRAPLPSRTNAVPRGAEVSARGRRCGCAPDVRERRSPRRVQRRRSTEQGLAQTCWRLGGHNVRRRSYGQHYTRFSAWQCRECDPWEVTARASALADCGSPAHTHRPSPIRPHLSI